MPIRNSGCRTQAAVGSLIHAWLAVATGSTGCACCFRGKCGRGRLRAPQWFERAHALPWQAFGMSSLCGCSVHGGGIRWSGILGREYPSAATRGEKSHVALVCRVITGIDLKTRHELTFPRTFRFDSSCDPDFRGFLFSTARGCVTGPAPPRDLVSDAWFWRQIERSKGRLRQI